MLKNLFKSMGIALVLLTIFAMFAIGMQILMNKLITYNPTYVCVGFLLIIFIGLSILIYRSTFKDR